MFCTKCGAKLQDDAKFCTACGTRVAQPNAADAQAAACEANFGEAASVPSRSGAGMATDAHAPETTSNANSADNTSPADAATNPSALNGAPAGEASNQTLKSAVKQTNQRSRQRVPLVVLVALALALAAGTAYAAYRVYVDVIAPSQQPAQTEQAVQGGSEQTTPAQPEESDANAEAPEVTEAPDNILQVSRVLALGSEGEQFITTHGASSKTAATETPWGYAAPLYSTNGDSVSWKDTARNMPYVDSSAGSASDYSSVTVEYGNGAMFLVHGLDKNAGTYQPASATPDSIVVSGVPLIGPITSSNIDDFAQQCGLSASSGSFEHTTENTIYEYGETTNETSTLVYTTNAFAGYQTVNGEKMVWYVIYTGFDDASEGGYSPHTATIGCAPIDLAEQLVAFSGLYTAEKWEGANDLTKASMLCASIVQELNSGNGVMSVNILTGEFRMFMNDSTGQGLGYYDECTESYDANGLLVLTGKKSGEVFETGMTKSQADEMKQSSGF